MIKKINYDSPDHRDEDGFPVYYETKNPLFEKLSQYHFDTKDMGDVFDNNFMNWFWDHLECRGDEFLITQNNDQYYIIHFPSGTIVNWYKYMLYSTNTCNKALTVDDLREFKKMLLADFNYEESEY